MHATPFVMVLFVLKAYVDFLSKAGMAEFESG